MSHADVDEVLDLCRDRSVYRMLQRNQINQAELSCFCRTGMRNTHEMDKSVTTGDLVNVTVGKSIADNSLCSCRQFLRGFRPGKRPDFVSSL